VTPCNFVGGSNGSEEYVAFIFRLAKCIHVLTWR